MTNLRRSVLDTRFVTIREWADVPLDMTAPPVAFTTTNDPTTTDWYPTDWAGNSTVQDDPTQPNYNLSYRDHRILVGPSPDAAVALSRSANGDAQRWLVWRQLTDNPEVPTDIVSGTITIF